MFKCQLANNYNPQKNYNVGWWWSSPKLDGVRALYIPGQGLMNRSQKQNFLGLEHIETICKQMGGFLDGELYISHEKFDVISAIVRDRKNFDAQQKLRIQFHVFAAWSNESAWTDTDLMLLYSNEIPANQSSVISVPYRLIENTPSAIQAEAQRIKEAGISQEGIMLRHPDIAYYQGRSHHLLKVKNFVKSIFTVTGFQKGAGKYSASLGKLLVKGTVNQQEISAKVGTGFTDTERLNIWNNQTQYLAREVEIIYLGTTLNRSLRHPVFSRFL